MRLRSRKPNVPADSRRDGPLPRPVDGNLDRPGTAVNRTRPALKISDRVRNDQHCRSRPNCSNTACSPSNWCRRTSGTRSRGGPTKGSTATEAPAGMDRREHLDPCFCISCRALMHRICRNECAARRAERGTRRDIDACPWRGHLCHNYGPLRLLAVRNRFVSRTSGRLREKATYRISRPPRRKVVQETPEVGVTNPRCAAKSGAIRCTPAAWDGSAGPAAQRQDVLLPICRVPLAGGAGFVKDGR